MNDYLKTFLMGVCAGAGVMVAFHVAGSIDVALAERERKARKAAKEAADADAAAKAAAAAEQPAPKTTVQAEPPAGKPGSIHDDESDETAAQPA